MWRRRLAQDRNGAVRNPNLKIALYDLALQSVVDTGSNGAWLPTTSVDQIGNTLATWFGMSAADIAYTFPNLANWSAGVRNVGFI